MNVTEPPKVARREAPAEPTGAERPPVHPLLWAMVIAMVAIEALQHLAAAGLVPEIFSRWVVFSLFAFFDTDFEAARAGLGISAQLVWSTVTHAFLHAGWIHLGLNMAVMLALGHAIVRALGFARFFVAFVLCAISGALTLAVLSDINGPLVGASGAIFGFFAMVTAWQERALRLSGRSRRPIWGRLIGLAAINILLALGLGRLLAWEAHLGGFVAGWLLAMLWRPRPIRLPF